MNEEQINSLIEQLKAAGLEEDDIMNVFYETFEKGKMDRKDLETLANVMGYELTDEFKNDPTPDPIASEGAEDMSEEDLKNARTLEESGADTPEEFKEEMEDKAENTEIGEGEEDEDDEADDTEEADEDTDEGDYDAEGDDDAEDEDEDDADWKKAQKMFKL